MLPADIPDEAQLIDLMDHRAVPSVTIALESSPLPQDHERVRIALRDSIDDALRRLGERKDVPHGARRAVETRLTSLIDHDDFWAHQSRSIVAFASPERLHVFRLADRVGGKVVVGDRFDTSRLLRTISYPSRIFVLQLSERLARLTEIGPDHGPIEHALDLPDDHELMLHHADNDGDADRDRAQGATGDRVERARFCRTVQDEVVRVVPDHVPLLLAATTDLAPAYRAVNTHPELLGDGVEAHPESLDDRDIERLAREALDRLRDDETAAWKEDFGTLRAQNLATTRLAEVAAAAASAAIDELRFDLESDATGRIDEFGNVVDRDAPDAPPLVDEIAARVLRTGGRVRAVRNADLLDGSPLAATLRFAVPT
ncbi:baeRF11 domain-containing protein, partial [Microbacterium sp. CPCC 204701]|uniref:baeRF11 domain-containing protein n=1 Tax=Microbacterium sp. CPCC 204701 TaxID=2493084 RepID=UPI000FD76CB0